MIIICAGMFRSGSTWQYQVVGELLRRRGDFHLLGYRFGEQIPPLIDLKSSWTLFKSHEGHPICADWLAAGHARCLYSYRDLRDVAFSMAYKQSQSLRDTVIKSLFIRRAIAADRFWRSQVNVFVQRYEEWIHHPAGFVSGIAAHIDIALEPGEADEIAAKFSLDANKHRTELLAERLRCQGVDLDDPRNTNCHEPLEQLHWNHIRQGGSRGWQHEATPEDIALLACECGHWLSLNGYEMDPISAKLGEEAQKRRDADYRIVCLKKECEYLRDVIKGLEKNKKELEC